VSRCLITGGSSTVIGALVPLLPVDNLCLTRRLCDMRHLGQVDYAINEIQSSDWIVVAHGMLSAEPFLTRDQIDIQESMAVNLLSVVRICEIALQANPDVRICVIGSESVRKGSHDVAYWLAKAALHAYVRGRRLEHPGQQLVCVAPSMIGNTGMTRQKTEAELAEAIERHPKHRPVGPLEVAKLIHFLLFTDEGYITNTVVEMDGGKFAGRK
jgi:NAD(P)-dependent dehydrogenase (short-subunit alcohol dehydrogenase family)